MPSQAAVPMEGEITSKPSRTMIGNCFCFSGRRIAILLLAWISLFAGIHKIPIEDHEALVLQTTREMDARSDWVLPYCNEQPRLKKPPLNYWMTKAISQLDPLSSDIEPWHGRACSMLGGLILLLVMAYACEKTYGGQTGFLIVVMLLGTKGFADFSHHARPDFLYAVLCVCQLSAWVGAWRAMDGSSTQRWLAWLGWCMAGLAILSKGPQVPALFLLGFLLYMVFGDGRCRMLRVLRPLSGLLILLAVCLPWWCLLQQRLETSGIDITQTQLSGSLLQTLSGWKEILGFYYVFNLLNLLLPLSLLLPLMIARSWRELGRSGDVERLLMCVCGTTLVVFTFAGHYRPHYMLPVLPLITVLLGAWINRVNGHLIVGVVWRVLIWLGVVAFVVGAGLLVWHREYSTLVLLSCIGGVMFWLLRREACEADWREHRSFLSLIGGSLAFVLLFAGSSVLPMRHPTLVSERQLALSISEMIAPGDHLATWRLTLDILPYYTRHRVDRVAGLDEVRARYEQMGSGHYLYVVIPKKALAELEGGFELSVLKNEGEASKAEGGKLVCARIIKIRS